MSYQCMAVPQWPLLLAIAVVIVYFIYRQCWVVPFSFFASRGIAFRKPWPIFGNYAALTMHWESLFDVQNSIYNEFKGKRFYGVFDFSRPFLSIADPDLIRNILVNDFDHFPDHFPLFENVEKEPLLGRLLFQLKGPEWRQLRTALTPAFTGLKMRQMFQMVFEASAQTTAILVAQAQASHTPIVSEMKDLCMRFSCDISATIAYGLCVNSHAERKNPIFAIAVDYTNFRRIRTNVGLALVSAVPNLMRFFGCRVMDRKLPDFFNGIVQKEIAHRTRENVQRPDMIQMLMDAQKKLDIHPDDVFAQCFMFFIAGFDTIASLTSFGAHELMENPAVQQRLIEELDAAKTALEGGDLTFEVLNGMRYLDWVCTETLRKWPPTVLLNRLCRKTYQMADEKGHIVTLEPGDAISIPLIAIQRDAQYFADPERFDPERFSDERKHEIPPFTFLPFGVGQRNCIGQRFALMVGKIFLYHLLTEFSFERCEETKTPIRLLPNRFILLPKDGLNIWLKPRV